MSEIYEVEIIQTMTLLVEADNESEAEDMAIEVSVFGADFDVETFTMPVTPKNSELVICDYGDFTYGELLEIRELIDAVPAPDPNQRELFNELG